MLELRYVTHGELVEPTSCAVLVLRGSINREVLESNYPYEGTFHYRLKAPDRDGYHWLDVLPNEDAISISQSTQTLEIQVLVLSADLSQESYSDYFTEMLNKTQSFEDIPIRRTSSNSNEREKAGSTPVNLQSITKGATSVWNTIVSTAVNIHQTLTHSVPLTDEAEQFLSELSDKLATSFEETEHTPILVQLWSVLFPSASFERVSSKWKDAGFQGNDPIKDLKQSMVLS